MLSWFIGNKRFVWQGGEQHYILQPPWPSALLSLDFQVSGRLNRLVTSLRGTATGFRQSHACIFTRLISTKIYTRSVSDHSSCSCMWETFKRIKNLCIEKCINDTPSPFRLLCQCCSMRLMRWSIFVWRMKAVAWGLWLNCERHNQSMKIHVMPSE